MTDKKITQLSSVVTMVDTDAIPIVVDTQTVPVTKKIAGTNLKTFFRNTFNNEYVNKDGWIPANETWTYVSATSFSISGDVTYKYQKGDKIKMGQSGTKYFYVLSAVYSSPNTIVTVTGGSTYTIANAGISLNYFSKSENPYGFPDWFNWTPTLTGFSFLPPSSVYRFKISGRACTIIVYQGGNGTSNATTFTISLPIQASASSSVKGACGFAVDNDISLTSASSYLISASATAISLYKDMATGAWTGGGWKRAGFTAIYEI